MRSAGFLLTLSTLKRFGRVTERPRPVRVSCQEAPSALERRQKDGNTIETQSSAALPPVCPAACTCACACARGCITVQRCGAFSPESCTFPALLNKTWCRQAPVSVPQRAEGGRARVNSVQVKLFERPRVLRGILHLRSWFRWVFCFPSY